MVAAVGVLAFSVAGFSIYGKMGIKNPIVDADNSNSSSQTTNANSSDKISSSSDSSSSSNNSSSNVSSTDNTSSSSPTVEDATPFTMYQVLTGNELDDILEQRTGVSMLKEKAGFPQKILDEIEKQQEETKKEENQNNSSEANNSSSSMVADNTNVNKDNSSSDTSSSSSQSSSSSSSSSSSNPTESSSSSQSSEESKPPQKITLASLGSSGAGNIPAWQNKNSDVEGWLRIPNTNIDFPVVIGPDTLYYNDKGYSKEASKNGVIWADSATTFGKRNQISQNTVIYGHNWTNYSSNPYIARPQDIMFAQLTSFYHLSFAKTTPYIFYSTEDEEMIWKVFAVLYTESSWNYIESDAGTSYIQSLISEAKQRSMHKYDVDVNANDKILTLSTCTRAYGKRDDQRFVVMARLLRKGEEVSEVKITENTNFKRPQF